MKYFLISSSIFYLLGLKFTSNIDLKTQLPTDSTTIKKEIIQPQKLQKEDKIKQEVIIQKNDSVVAAGMGSDEMLAPFCEYKMN